MNLDYVHKRVIRDMSEGLMTIGLNGKIEDINPAALQILGKETDVIGLSLASVFFGEEDNDAFVQTILDAIYETNVTHKNIVPYVVGHVQKTLSVTTSFLLQDDKKVALVAVISDISELYELRDAVKAMEKIRSLNEKLELRNKLLSDTFGRFLSDEIVRNLLDTPDGLALGGKKRRLSILMSDLRGFTRMSEQMSAQDLITMLNHYLGEMTEIIQKHSGTIIEFIGDGILAVFGAPVESAESATQAVSAGVEMQCRMAKINNWNGTHHFPTLDMGIGIHTGEVIVGNIGSEKRTKYGVCGSNVNLCGRIESYTTGGQVLISESTRQEIAPELQIADTFTVRPKGVEQDVTLHRVVGIGEPYNLCCEQTDCPPVPLAVPEPLVFYTLDGKHTSPDAVDGIMLARSAQEAILQTDYPLSVFDNILISGSTKIFAKVIASDGQEHRIHFTSK